VKLHVEGDGFSVSNQDGDSRELHDIINVLLPRFLALFSTKNKDYGAGGHEGLGVRAQYVDLSRKVLKLKRVLWDNEGLEHEQVDEVLLDLIGHCFLTLQLLQHSEMGEAAEREWVYGNDPISAVSKFIEQCGGPRETLKVLQVLPSGDSPFMQQVSKHVQDILMVDRLEAGEAMRAPVSPEYFEEVVDDGSAEIDSAARKYARRKQRADYPTDDEWQETTNKLRRTTHPPVAFDGSRMQFKLDGMVVSMEFDGGETSFWLEVPNSDRVRLQLISNDLVERSMKSAEVLQMSMRDLYRGFAGC
jgi:hypothetical protein